MKLNYRFNTRIFGFSLVTLVLLLVVILISNLFSTKEPIYIAFVSSMNEAYQAAGEDMLKNTQLYLESVNKAGGINGKPVKLRVYDDQGDVNKARQVALDIVKQNEAHIVLGHYFSSACIEAGKVYQEAKIPAIAGTAQADAVTARNDWYFRSIPNGRFYGVFSANYVKKILKHDTVSIIYDNNDTPLENQ